MYTPPAVGYLNYTWYADASNVMAFDIDCDRLMMNQIACNGTGGNQIYPLNANWYVWVDGCVCRAPP